MATSQKSRSAVVAIVIALAALGSLLRFMNSVADRPHVPFPMDPSEYRVVELAHQTAIPGRSLHLKVAGKEVASYEFSGDDAAVTVVSVTSRSTGRPVPVIAGDGSDQAGHEYATRVHTEDGYNFVSILRGYAKAPPEVLVPLYFVPRASLASKDNPSMVLKFHDLAPAERVLTPPVGRLALSAEENIYANYAPSTHSIALFARSGSIPMTTVLASSFTSRESVNDWNGLASHGIDHQYDDVSDAIKVRLENFRPVTKNVVLIYKNAEIIKDDQQPLLVLPTSQVVGNVSGRKIIIEQRDPTKTSADPATLRSGISIRIDPPSLPTSHRAEPGFQLPADKFGDLKMLPSPATWGIDAIYLSWTCGQLLMGSVRVPGQSKGGFPLAPGMKLKVPELEITAKLTTYEKLNSETVVLPVHHDPMLGQGDNGLPLSDQPLQSAAPRLAVPTTTRRTDHP